VTIAEVPMFCHAYVTAAPASVTTVAEQSNYPLLRALSGAFKLMRLRAQNVLEQHGLHYGQQYVLEVLWAEDGLPVGELAARIGIAEPTVVRAVQRMEAAGVVRREADPSDRRRALIFLTDRGRELEQVVIPALKEVEREGLARLSPKARAELRRSLEHVRDNYRDEIS
jgi:DNA-binding MarR family transcriptional regulator